VTTITLPGNRTVKVVRSRSPKHRQHRWERVMVRIAQLNEPARSEAFGYVNGLLDAMLLARAEA
jgi:hypothetical protein